MRRLVQVVHGFPPRENAGTERVAALAAGALRLRGWEVHTLAATREAGAPMYAEREEPGVSRLVTNAPYAGVRQGGLDRAARAWIEHKLAALRPDVVHVHHLAYLDAGFTSPAPVVWTLHDAWAWCAAGGQLLHEGAACRGPGAACAGCATAWAKDGPAVGVALAAAGRAAAWVPPAHLHRAWQRLPARVRSAVTRGAAPVTAAQVEARAANYRAFAARCRAVLAPSRWLADEAGRQGLGRVRVVPNGVAGRSSPLGGGPFLFLGTIAAHKGPDLVRDAHARSGVATPLRVVGPDGPDAAYVAAVPHEPPVADVTPLLRSARALVLGSRWPENAPLVVLEARAAGCPVIAPAIGGLPELVKPGVDGWLYPPGDVEALARVLLVAEASPPLPVRPPPSIEEHVDALLGVYDGCR